MCSNVFNLLYNIILIIDVWYVIIFVRYLFICVHIGKIFVALSIASWLFYYAILKTCIVRRPDMVHNRCSPYNPFRYTSYCRSPWKTDY